MKDYYRILEIPGNATQPEIRKAYYKKAHQFHPDKTTDPKHHQIFLDINEAYEILGDKKKREIYHYRWVNFHNPPKAKVYTGTTTQTAAQPQSQPYYKTHYQNYSKPTYQELEPYFRWVCLAVLFISAVIILDYVAAVRLPNETILDYAIYKTRSEHTLWIFTEHTKFRLPFQAYSETATLTGQHLNVYQTPILKQITKIDLNGKTWTVNLGSIYHTFFFLVVLQTGLALGGLFKKISWNNRMNFSIVAGLCTIITILIIALT